MREITYDEYIDILFEILKYFDNICRENNIQYTLYCGSLIGAIRHSDIIPWDDDIDVALTSENYKKLKEVMQKQNSRYIYLDNSIEKTYYYPFAKIVDSNTIAYEDNNRRINNYGVYIDVFEINNVSDNENIRKKNHERLSSLKRIFGVFADTDENLKKKSIIKKIRNFLIFKIGCSFFIKKYNSLCEKYNNDNTTHMMFNWPTYGYNHEILPKEYYERYTNKKFRNINAMVSANYDEILKSLFGNYMELPPEKDRIPKHNIKAYWREDTNEKK